MKLDSPLGFGGLLSEELILLEKNIWILAGCSVLLESNMLNVSFKLLNTWSENIFEKKGPIISDLG